MFNSKVCIIDWLMVRLSFFLDVVHDGSRMKANTYNPFERLKIDIKRIEYTRKVQTSSDIDRLS